MSFLGYFEANLILPRISLPVVTITFLLMLTSLSGCLNNSGGTASPSDDQDLKDYCESIISR